MSLWKISTLSLAVVAAPLVASAFETSPPTPNETPLRQGIAWGSRYEVKPSVARFTELDADGSGTIAADEWTASAPAFANHDWNGDGVLAGVELAVAKGRLGDADFGVGRFGTLDSDRNGVILPEEWPGGASTFLRLDRNGDGVIMRSEWLDSRLPSERRAWFEAHDTDGDGRLRLADWSGDDDAFNRLDADLDGLVDRDELIARHGVTERGVSRR